MIASVYGSLLFNRGSISKTSDRGELRPNTIHKNRPKRDGFTYVE